MKIKQLMGLGLLLLSVVSCASPPATPADPLTQMLASLERVDEHPLYVMRYAGDYPAAEEARAVSPAWGCSLFAALGDSDSMVYGRNFDWDHSPAVLLYTHPSDGYAALSLVNLGFLGFSAEDAAQLQELPRAKQEALLHTPFVPIDGMNERGLVVGMAAVNNSWQEADPAKPTIGSLALMRELLDHTQTVEEALARIERYNIDFTGGPPVHYLIADAEGNAALVEFIKGQQVVTRNTQPWHAATNFILASAGSNPRSYCSRYKTIDEQLTATEGKLTAAQAMALLQAASQPGSTQWSAVYNLTEKNVHVTLGRAYEQRYTFGFDEP